MTQPDKQPDEQPEEPVKKSYMEIRHNTYTRDGELRPSMHDKEKLIGGITLERSIYVHKNGMLEQHLYLMANDMVLAEESWHIEVPESYDNAIQALNKHWAQVRNSFDALTQDVAIYHEVKGLPRERQPAMMIHVMHEVGPLIVRQPMEDEQLLTGQLDKKDYPLLYLSEGMHGIRKTMRHKGLNLGGELDSFEKGLHKIERVLVKSARLYEGAIQSMRELEGTASDDDDEDWRGSAHSHADADSPQWADSDHDVDHARTARIQNLVEVFEDKVGNFKNDATRYWMGVALCTSMGQAFEPEPEHIEQIRTDLRELKKAYREFKNAAQESSIGNYEMRQLYDMLEDELMPLLERTMARVERPKDLQRIVAKALPGEKER